MYLNYYHLTCKPFEISPDPKFLWLGSKYMKTLASLSQGITENKALMILTGDSGTGKTMLINALSNRLSNDINFVQIFDPSMEELDFLNMTVNALEVAKKFDTKGDSLFQLNHSLNNTTNKDRKVVLVIEEAQRINPTLLKQIRLLSDSRQQEKTPITIIIVGQNEIIDLLKKNQSLGQRVNYTYHLEPLMDIEIEQYVMHRLSVAGSRKKIFSSRAIHEIYCLSEGIPFLINNICDFALLAGYKRKEKIITPDTIRKCGTNFKFANKRGKEGLTPDTEYKRKEKIITLDTTRTCDVNFQFPNKLNKESFAIPRRKASFLSSAVLIGLSVVIGYFYFADDYQISSMTVKTYYEKAIESLTGLEPEMSINQAKQNAIPKVENIEPNVRPVSFNTPIVSEIVQLGQSNVGNEKLSVDSLVKQLKTRNDEHVAALKALSVAKEKITAHEERLAKQEQLINQTKQELIELTKDLNKEKNDKILLQTELSKKAELIKSLQEKQEKLEYKTIRFEDQIEQRKHEVEALKAQLMALTNNPQGATPITIDAQDNPTSRSDAIETEIEPPNPNDIIDWIISKNPEKKRK